MEDSLLADDPRIYTGMALVEDDAWTYTRHGWHNINIKLPGTPSTPHIASSTSTKCDCIHLSTHPQPGM